MSYSKSITTRDKSTISQPQGHKTPPQQGKRQQPKSVETKS